MLSYDLERSYQRGRANGYYEGARDTACTLFPPFAVLFIGVVIAWAW